MDPLNFTFGVGVVVGVLISNMIYLTTRLIQDHQQEKTQRMKAFERYIDGQTYHYGHQPTKQIDTPLPSSNGNLERKRHD